MNEHKSGTVITPEIVGELREAARRRASVRELARIVCRRLGCQDSAYVPVIAGFVHAFHLPMLKALPIREWIGSNQDAEIDALILPEIARTRKQWDTLAGEDAAEVGGVRPEALATT